MAAAISAIENGLSTREAEAIRLNGSEYAANVDKLTLENERLRKANGSNPQPVVAPPEGQKDTPVEEEAPEEETEDENEAKE